MAPLPEVSLLIQRGRGVRGNRGGNFVGANRELREALDELDQKKIESEMMKRQINGYFILL